MRLGGERCAARWRRKDLHETGDSVMTREILQILDGQEPSLYLFGSVTMDDFHLGWSDIDFLCLTKRPISPAQREKLVPLRQTLLKAEPVNPYYRSFEGGMLSLDAFLTGKPEPAVYWGTSGQRGDGTVPFRLLFHWWNCWTSAFYWPGRMCAP